MTFRTDGISGHQVQQYTPEQVAYGFISVANEAMARPIRNLTTMKGYDVTRHMLACFGGAGPQHCCAIAKTLGMKKIFVHKFSGILSAFGLSLADVVVERQEPFSGILSESPAISCLPSALACIDRLEQDAIRSLEVQGFPSASIVCIRFLNCRYHGTDTSIMTSVSGSETYKERFVENYKREYGFELCDREVLVDDIRIRAVGVSSSSSILGECVQRGRVDSQEPPSMSEEGKLLQDRTFYDI